MSLTVHPNLNPRELTFEVLQITSLQAQAVDALKSIITLSSDTKMKIHIKGSDASYDLAD
jgi:hypothetical protein